MKNIPLNEMEQHGLESLLALAFASLKAGKFPPGDIISALISKVRLPFSGRLLDTPYDR
jgi:hypothetical protein